MRTNPSASKTGADLGRNMKDYDLEQARLAGENALGAGRNTASMVNELTTSAQGAGGPTIVALVQVPVKASGRFRWTASINVAGVATEVVTVSVKSASDTNVLVPTYTGAAAVPAANGMTNTAGGAQSEISNSGTPGTGIVIGGGFATDGTTIVGHGVTTIGTAALGFSYAAAGDLYNFGGAPAGGYPPGTHVYLWIEVTDSAANRACTGIVLSLEEIP